MEPRRAKPGSAPLMMAGFLLFQLAAAATLLRATEDGVSVAGIPLGGACLFRRLTGLPCPTCGMTRSVVLSLHGHLAAALRVNPAGICWVLAVAAIAAALLWLGWRQRTEGAARAGTASRRVRILALVQGVSVGVVLALHWIHALLVHG
jgi:hypothetical protein